VLGVITDAVKPALESTGETATQLASRGNDPSQCTTPHAIHRPSLPCKYRPTKNVSVWACQRLRLGLVSKPKRLGLDLVESGKVSVSVSSLGLEAKSLGLFSVLDFNVSLMSLHGI